MRKVANDDLDKMNHQEVPVTDTEELADRGRKEHYGTVCLSEPV